MKLDEVIEKLRAYIKTEFKIGPKDTDFNDDVHLFDYGYVDSFGAVKIIDFAASTFKVKISDQDLTIHSLNTVREIATLIHSRLEVKS